MVTDAARLPILDPAIRSGYRLVNSKFPPISLFDDVADQDEFELLFELQALTNPRQQNEVGNLNLLPADQIPFGITGCSYAVAPFTHVNPDGSRFSDGQSGVLYIADQIETALAEVRYHQQRYWERVQGLKFDRLVFRTLSCRFDASPLHDATVLDSQHPIYNPDDYQAARQLAAELRRQKSAALQYHSVRQPGSICWALFTPRSVLNIRQTTHYEMIWNGSMISAVNRLA